MAVGARQMTEEVIKILAALLLGVCLILMTTVWILMIKMAWYDSSQYHGGWINRIKSRWRGY
jgi:hypothetical protein